MLCGRSSRRIGRVGLAERFAADECSVEDSGLARIVELGELHPRATMLIAQKTHLTAVLLETRKIDLNLVEQGYLSALGGERINHEQTVERIRHMPQARPGDRSAPGP